MAFYDAERRRRLRLWHKLYPGEKLPRRAPLAANGDYETFYKIMMPVLRKHRRKVIESMLESNALYQRLASGGTIKIGAI